MQNSQDTSTKVEQVIQAERQWLKAHLELDLAALERLMADEYTLVSDRGELLDKSQVLAAFRAGKKHWDEAESDDYHIQIEGDIAIVRGRWRARGVNSGIPFDFTSRYRSVWIYRDGRWQIANDRSDDQPPQADKQE
jgi:ketosteroid isomerase-like protein